MFCIPDGLSHLQLPGRPCFARSHYLFVIAATSENNKDDDKIENLG